MNVSFYSSTDVRSQKYMNKLIPHLNESDTKNRIVEKNLKELKLLILIGQTFVFGGSIIKA